MELKLTKQSFWAIALASVLVFSVALVQFTYAQSEDSISDETTTEESVEDTSADDSSEEEVSELDLDVNEDTGEVTDTSLEDIDLNVPEKPPGRFGMFFRNIREQVSLVTTFDPVKKAEKHVKFAEERMQIAEKIAANSDDPKQQERAQEVIERASKFLEKVEEKKDAWLEKKDERAGKLLKNIANHQVRREKVLDKIEQHLPEDMLEEFQERRGEVLEKNDRLLQALQNENVPEEVREHLKMVKDRIEEHTQEIKKFVEQNKELFKAAKGGDEDARAKIEAIRKERTLESEEQRLRDDEVRHEFEEKFRLKAEELRAAAEAGDEEAMKKFEDFENNRPRLDDVIDNSNRARFERRTRVEGKVNDKRAVIRERVEERFEEHRERFDERREERLDDRRDNRLEEGDRRDDERPFDGERADLRKEDDRRDDGRLFDDNRGDEATRPEDDERPRGLLQRLPIPNALKERLNDRRENAIDNRSEDGERKDFERNKIIDPIYRERSEGIIDPIYKEQVHKETTKADVQREMKKIQPTKNIIKNLRSNSQKKPHDAAVSRPNAQPKVQVLKKVQQHNNQVKSAPSKPAGKPTQGKQR
jgi:hypothetical protein